MGTITVTAGQLIAGVVAIFTVVGAIYTVKTYHKKDTTVSQKAIGKNISQAGRDIKKSGD